MKKRKLKLVSQLITILCLFVMMGWIVSFALGNYTLDIILSSTIILLAIVIIIFEALLKDYLQLFAHLTWVVVWLLHILKSLELL